jgi:formate dehydrogenase alpha subunit
MTNSIEDLTTQAKSYLIIGSNTTEQHPVIGMRLRQAAKRGAKLIVADPRKTKITDFAVMHLQHKPGSDIALLNSLMNVLIAEDLYDKEFVANRTEGFDELKACVAKYTPEYAEKITGVSAEDVRKAARLLAANKPGALIYAMGITQHVTGHQNVLSTANLQMLLGNMGVPGGGVNPLRGQSNVQGACDMGCLPNFYPAYQKVVDEPAHTKFVEAWGNAASLTPGLTIVEMMNAAHSGKLKAMFVLGENPMMSDPDLNHVREALNTLDFLVVQDIFMNETAELADVVLPGASFAEKDGTNTNTERRVQRVRKAIEPLGDSKPDWVILCDLFKRVEARLGTDRSKGKFASWDYESPKAILAEINAVAPSYGGITWERIENVGLQWPCPNTEHPGTQFLHAGKFTRGLGKFHAVEWMPPAEEPDEKYPFVLTTGRVLFHFHGGTMSRRSAGLNAIYPEGKVEIHPQDATKLGVADGELVRVSSRRGEVVAKAEVVEKADPGVIFMTFHFKEAAANLLTIAALDPVAKIPEYKVAAVRVEKV